jgi:hypothetical protein
MNSSKFALPRDIMDSQLSAVELMMAMFSENEIEVSEDTTVWIERLRRWCDGSEETSPPNVPENIPFTLSITVPDRPETIQMSISVPLQSSDSALSDPPPMRYFLRQPAWLSKADVAELTSSMPQDDIFTAIEYLREESHRFIAPDISVDGDDSIPDTDPIIRVWYYFPSLSTREKRDDMVNHAPGYGLTGFVLAGKPGVLCLEGTSSSIDKYMNFIKTHSWGDIPSHQKKVSERFREENGKESVSRAFEDMQEITNDLGDRGGKRANRGDMKALESWLHDKGLGVAFAKVIF